MQELWNNFLYEPIYNALFFIIDNITLGDVGYAIIILTILIKFILSPLAKKSIKNQVLIKKMEPEMKAIKKEYPSKEDQARKTMELYKKYGTNPFSGCLVVILQLPIILALYYVFLRGVTVNPEILYSFISFDGVINTNFLGLIEMGGKSIALAILVGVTQFIQGHLSMPINSSKDHKNTTENNEKPSFQEELSKSMQTNTRYVLPVFLAIVAWQISAAVALYWITSNIFTIVQEWLIRNKLKQQS
jgi:YidC/Oxa1 family membrane protein insertase